MVLTSNVLKRVLMFATLTTFAASCPTSGSVVTLNTAYGISDSVLSKELLSNCPRNATSIDLSSNHFITVNSDAFEDFYSLTTIILTNNQITELPVGVLDKPFKSSLAHLHADKNKISLLNNGLFESNVNLKTINLAENTIDFIDTNVFHKQLTKLELVNISHNQLTYFEPWPYVPEIPQDDDIDLIFDCRYNLIEKFTNTINWTYDLVDPYEYEVYLQFNSLSNLTNDVLFQYRDHPADLSILTELISYRLNISNNPVICNCKVYDLVKDIHSSFFRYYQVDKYRYDCGSPSHLKGVDLMHDLDIDQLVCNTTSECPSKCTCQEQPYISTLVINCTNANLREIPKTIPELSSNIHYVSLYLDGNDITEITKRNYSNIIKNLTVANNYLNYIDGEAIKEMKDLESLDISGNYIKSVPKEIQKLSFDKVKIRGNPFECDCNIIWMADWISLSNGIIDASISCSWEGETKIIKDITEESLHCNVDNLIIIFGTGAGVLVVIIIAVFITAKRCPYETKVLIYRFLRIHPRDRYVVDHEITMEYDAYLSYDGDDIQVRQWIRTIFMRKLEENGRKKYSFFCPQRDALAGEDYSQDLVEKMVRSRRVFILLSPGYFKDPWRIFESDRAEMEHNENDKSHPRVVYIIWNEENQEILRKLKEEPWKSRLIKKRIISPDERFFWSKIRYELPIKPRKKSSRVNNCFVNDEYRKINKTGVTHTREKVRPNTADGFDCNELHIEDVI